jgi:hypothetical protein
LHLHLIISTTNLVSTVAAGGGGDGMNEWRGKAFFEKINNTKEASHRGER